MREVLENEQAHWPIGVQCCRQEVDEGAAASQHL